MHYVKNVVSPEYINKYRINNCSYCDYQREYKWQEFDISY